MFHSNNDDPESQNFQEAKQEINHVGSLVDFVQVTLNEAFALPLIDLIESAPIDRYEQKHIPEFKAMMISVFTSPHLFKAKLVTQKMQLHILMLAMKCAEESLSTGIGTRKEIFKKFSDFSREMLLPCDVASGYLINENTYQVFWDSLKLGLPLKTNVFLQPFENTLWSYLSQFFIHEYDFSKPINTLYQFSEKCKALQVLQQEYVDARQLFKDAFKQTGIAAVALVDQDKPENVALSSFLEVFYNQLEDFWSDKLGYTQQVFQALVDTQLVRLDPSSLISEMLNALFETRGNFLRPQPNLDRELFPEKIRKAKAILPNATFQNPFVYYASLTDYDLFHQNHAMSMLELAYLACQKEYGKPLPALTDKTISVPPAETKPSQSPAPASVPKEKFAFSDYLKFYKCKLFGTHHKKRMVALSEALYKLKDDVERTELLERMLDLLQGKAFTPEQAIFEDHILPRWTTQVDRTAVGHYEKSGCYQAILKLRNELNPTQAPRLAPRI